MRHADGTSHFGLVSVWVGMILLAGGEAAWAKTPPGSWANDVQNAEFNEGINSIVQNLVSPDEDVFVWDEPWEMESDGPAAGAATPSFAWASCREPGSGRSCHQTRR